MEKLQVPENITLRWEAWRGVGKPELAAILSITFFALLVSVAYCFISEAESDKLIAVYVVVMTFATGCGLFSKLDNNQSIYDFFRRQARFKREQQTFRWHRKIETEVYLFAEEKDR